MNDARGADASARAHSMEREKVEREVRALQDDVSNTIAVEQLKILKEIQNQLALQNDNSRQESHSLSPMRHGSAQQINQSEIDLGKSITIMAGRLSPGAGAGGSSSSTAAAPPAKPANKTRDVDMGGEEVRLDSNYPSANDLSKSAKSMCDQSKISKDDQSKTISRLGDSLFNLRMSTDVEGCELDASALFGNLSKGQVSDSLL